MREELMKVKEELKEVKEEGYAIEILKDFKAMNRRMFVVLMTVLVMWFATICYLVLF